MPDAILARGRLIVIKYRREIDLLSRDQLARLNFLR
jgi:hypothetical protein